MKSSILRNILVAVIGLAVIGGIWAVFGSRQLAQVPADDLQPATTTTSTVVTSTVSEPDMTSATSRVKVALLDFSGDSSPGKQRGCDHVVLVEREVTPTTAPLTSALRELFAIKETTVGGYGNFMPKTRSTLSFDRVTVDNGVAKVYLTGSLSGLAGVCDDPRASIQIEETALQFPTVRSVELYLNGERTNLVPNESGL